jgi:autotransporter translocation and assembly factor TamB
MRRTFQALAFACTLIVGVASMAAIITQTAWFKEWLRGFIVRQAGEYVNGELSIGRLGGNLFFGVRLEDVDVTQNGKTVVDIENVGLDYNAFTFIGGDVVLDDIHLNRPVLRLERTPDGWNLARLIKARTPDPDEPKNRRTIEIGEIGISDGTLYVEEGAIGTSGIDAPARIERLDASVGVKSNEDELTVEIGHVSLRAAEPGFGVNALSGVVRRTPDTMTFENVSLRTEESSLSAEGSIRNIEGGEKVIALKASSDKLALNEIAKLVPALRGFTMQPAFEVTASGPADRLNVDLNVRDARLGSAVGDLIVDASGSTRRVAGTVDVANFNIAPLLRREGASREPASAPERRQGAPINSDITGTARIDLALPSGRVPLSGTYSVNASEVAVAGYNARNVVGEGRIDGQTIRVSARADAYGGRATAAGSIRTGEMLELDLEGRAEGLDMRNLPAQLNAPGVPSNLTFGYTVTGRGRAFSGDVSLDESTLAGATLAAGTTGRFSVGDGAPTYEAKGQVANLDVQQVGRGFNIRAIAADKYRSRINTSFDLKGSGGGRYPLTLDATGTATDSEMFGASFPQLAFTTTIAEGDIRVKSIGRFAGLNPAVIAGNERLDANLSGDVNADTTIRSYEGPITVDSIDVAGTVNLTRSSFAGLTFDTANVDGRYANRQGEITTLAIAGPDLNANAQGTIALNDTGASNLSVHVESPSLDRLAELVGQPIKGAAVVDATVTGNATELKAQGTLQGSNIGHGDNEALSLKSEFSASIPQLTAADATVQAKSAVTFLEVGGQQISELTADTTYAMSALQFNATAKEGMRELQAAGKAVFQPDAHQIHLSNIALRSEQIQWATAPGSAATVQYGKEQIAVQNLQLVSGDQRISADGVFGSTTEALRVRAENVDVAQLDQLMLGEQRLAGRLSANASITGERRAPRVDGTFTLANGAFRMFTFDSLTGTVDYAGRGVNVDVRLQQTQTAWLTAKGYAPLSLFRTTPPDVEGVHTEPAPGEAVNLQVESSLIDLGVVQGFTSYVTDVAGTLQANVRVTGSGEDPHLDGAIDIRGGAFAVPDLGTNYTGLDTRVSLTTDGVTINEFKILDNRGFPMTIGGTLATHARTVGAVNITVQSENFEVIDNQLADVKLDTQIQITGELRKPKVVGSLEVENGTIQVGRLLERFNANPYGIEAASFEEAPAANGQAQASIFEALELEIGLAVPSNLVLRGNELRPNAESIEVGDMNVTVGGVLQIRKLPGGKPTILGEVNTVRGNYAFQGRRFEILRDGRIRFGGTEEIDPLIDIRARRVISGVETFVRVQGSMREPELTFTSNPPLDQADILSLIVFNQPINELGEGEQVSLAERAGALAGGYLTSNLARSIGNALELDEFEIQATGDQGLGPSLTVGEQVGEKLFVRVRQAFGEAQATEFILEYQLADYLRLQATAAEASGGTQRVRFRRVERGGIDLIFFFSY